MHVIKPEIDESSGWDWKSAPAGPPPVEPNQDNYRTEKGRISWRKFRKAHKAYVQARQNWINAVEGAQALTEDLQNRIISLIDGGMSPTEIAAKVGIKPWNQYAAHNGKPIVTPSWTNPDGIPSSDSGESSGPSATKIAAMVGIPLAFLLWG